MVMPFLYTHTYMCMSCRICWSIWRTSTSRCETRTDRVDVCIFPCLLALIIDLPQSICRNNPNTSMLVL